MKQAYYNKTDLAYSYLHRRKATDIDELFTFLNLTVVMPRNKKNSINSNGQDSCYYITQYFPRRCLETDI